MQRQNERNLGIVMTVAGLAALVFAVLLVGLTKAGGGIDWVSVATAVAGLVLAGAGLFEIFRHRGTAGATGGPTPHAAS